MDSLNTHLLILAIGMGDDLRKFGVGEFEDTVQIIEIRLIVIISLCRLVQVWYERSVSSQYLRLSDLKLKDSAHPLPAVLNSVTGTGELIPTIY